MLRNAILAFAFFVSILATGPPAVADCITVQKVSDWIMTDHPEAQKLYMKGTEATSFMAGLNAMKPVTDYKADEILIFQAPSKQPFALMVTFVKGCMNRQGQLPILVLRLIQRGM